MRKRKVGKHDIAHWTYELLVDACMKRNCMKVYDTRVELSSEVSRGGYSYTRSRE